MNALAQVFEFKSRQVRTVIQDGQPWFVAKDVCDVLEIGDVSKAVGRLDEDEKGTNSIPTLGGEQEMLVINESGLYSFILTSRKPEAKQFKRWITHEVIPSIRNTGQYSIQSETEFQLPQTFADALRLYANQVEANEQLELQNKMLTPKAESFDTFMSAENTQPMGIAAKSLGIGRNDLYKRLRDEKILMSGHRENNLPYQRFIDAGYFIVKETPVQMGDNTYNKGQTMITPRGIEYIASRLGFKKNLPQ
jgi:anti-repressor protein